MSPWRYILASLRQYRRVHLAVAAGVALAAAVITGALLVGHSVRSSLRELALTGLGRIDSILLGERPFSASLAPQLAQSKAAAGRIDAAVPLVLATGALTADDGDEPRRASAVNIIGADPAFWILGDRRPRGLEPFTSFAKLGPPVDRKNQVALTAALADELNAEPGDSILIRLPAPANIPADSTLGEKEETTVARRFIVSTILDQRNRPMARFGIRPSQQAPRNAFVTLQSIQDVLDIGDKINAVALAVPTGQSDQALPQRYRDILRAVIRRRATLDDLGIYVSAERTAAPAERYFRISADRLVLPPYAVEQATSRFADDAPQRVITYLANSIAAGDKSIPYSVVVGVDSTRHLGPLLDRSGQLIKLGDDEVALNDWAAQELGAKVGDRITLRFYEPETTHGALREHQPPIRLRLAAVVPLEDDAGQPTPAADPALAPELPGVTDQESINQWRLPFELTEEIRDQDEAYWDERRTTPKAFVSYKLAARLWRTRWGTDSLVRIPAVGDPDLRQFAAALSEQLEPDRLGLTLLPVKQEVLAASRGATPFEWLFLGFSLFLMASAIMLTALLFRLGVDHRARELGLLLAVGLTPRRVRLLLVAEGAIVAAAGAIVGAVAGIAYAALMVYGLNTWWVAATVTPFIELHIHWPSLLIGALAGLVVAVSTIAWSLRTTSRLQPRQLMAGNAEPPHTRSVARSRAAAIIPAACLAAAVALGVAAVRWEGEAQAGAFFAAGALALTGILIAVRAALRQPTSRPVRSLTLAGLSARNVRRNPSRSMLSLALAATASFLIVALSAFRLAPTDAGTGGYDLSATADLPILYDLNSPEGRTQLGFSDDDSAQLDHVHFESFRLQAGQDASCLNLYQTTQPRVLGAAIDSLGFSRFQWASVIEAPGRRAGSPWQALRADLGNDEAGRPIIPMVLDRNTAFYSLKLYKLGDRLTIRDGFDQPVTLELVGMLTNSVLQGELIISERNFLRLFPETAGRRFFLIRAAAGSPPLDELTSLLEAQLEDYGFDAASTRERLAQLMAVQNTYLSTFQSLGAFGLLLGAVGLAVAQVRSVVERRAELALLQAAGFSRARLVRMVIGENLVLLVGGLAIGALAAAGAVLPHALIQQVSVPLLALAVMLAAIVAAGVLAARLAAAAALSAPLVPALRGD